VPLTEAALSEIDDNSSYAQILALSGSGLHVLDVGCGPGNLAALLTRRGSTVVGLDADLRSLDSARQFCESVHAIDLDREDLTDSVGGQNFDAIVFADILEHLRDPLRVLLSAKMLLREGGSVFVSIPNIAHGAVRLALLRGEFSYQRLGILDETHVHFYTKSTVEELLNDAGLDIVETRRTVAPIFEESDLVPFVRREDFSAALVDEIESDPESRTLQFIVKAQPIAHATATITRFRRATLAQDLRTLEARYAQLERGAEELRSANAGLTDEFRRVSHAYGAAAEELRSANAGLTDEFRRVSHAYGAAIAERDANRRRADMLGAAVESVEESLRSFNETCVGLLAQLEERTRELEAALQEQRDTFAAKTKLKTKLYAAYRQIYHLRNSSARNDVVERLLIERETQIARIAAENQMHLDGLELVTNLHVRLNRQTVTAMEAAEAEWRERERALRVCVDALTEEMAARRDRLALIRGGKVWLRDLAIRVARKSRRWIPF